MWISIKLWIKIYKYFNYNFPYPYFMLSLPITVYFFQGTIPNGTKQGPTHPFRFRISRIIPVHPTRCTSGRRRAKLWPLIRIADDAPCPGWCGAHQRFSLVWKSHLFLSSLYSFVHFVKVIFTVCFRIKSSIFFYIFVFMTVKNTIYFHRKYAKWNFSAAFWRVDFFY